MKISEVRKLISNIIVESEADDIGELLGSETEEDQKKAALLAAAKGIFEKRFDNSHEIGCIRASGKKSENKLLWFVYKKNCTTPMTFSDGSSNPSTVHIFKDFRYDGEFGSKIVKDVPVDHVENPQREYIYTKDESGEVIGKKEVYIASKMHNPMIRITSPEREFALHEKIAEIGKKSVGNFILGMPYLTKKDLEISSSQDQESIAIARREAMNIASGEDSEFQSLDTSHKEEVFELESKLEKLRREKNDLITTYREIKSDLDNATRTMKGISSQKEKSEYYNGNVLPLEEEMAELLTPNSTTGLDPFENLDRYISKLEERLEELKGSAPKRESLSVTRLNYTSFSVIPRDIDYSRYGIVKYLCMSIGFEPNKMARTYDKLVSLNLQKGERYYTEKEVRLMLRERGLRTSDIAPMTKAQILALGKSESIEKAMDAYYKLLEIGGESYVTKFAMRLAIDNSSNVSGLGQKLFEFMELELHEFHEAKKSGEIERSVRFEDVSRSVKEFMSLMAAAGASDYLRKAKASGKGASMLATYLRKSKEYADFEYMCMSGDIEDIARMSVRGQLESDPTPFDSFTSGSRDFVFVIEGAKSIFRLIGLAYKKLRDSKEEKEVAQKNKDLRAANIPMGVDSQTTSAKVKRRMTDYYLGKPGVQTRQQAQSVADAMIAANKRSR